VVARRSDRVAQTDYDVVVVDFGVSGAITARYPAEQGVGVDGSACESHNGRPPSTARSL
jgi:hypothetical protein